MSEPASHDLRTLAQGQSFVHDSSFEGQGASVVVLMKTGARDEFENEFGISHFLEHMVFKGTNSRSAMDLTLAFGDLGAQVNAYTSDEQTVFYGTVLKQYASDLHDLLIDMMNPLLSNDDFNVEKKVILEEIALYEDRPNYMLYEKAMADFFSSHGVGQSVLGTTASIEAVSRDDMAAYVARRYLASNVIVSLCGDLDTDQFASLTEERSKGLPTSAVPESPVSKANLHGKQAIFRHIKNTQAHILGLAEGPSATDPLRYAALLLSVIVGDSQNSRLYWELVDTGLAEYASFDPEDKDGVGCWMLSVSTAPDAWEEVRDKALNVLQSVQSSLTEEELERAKTKALSRLVMDSELPLGKAMANALCLQYRNAPFVLSAEIESLTNVTLADCQALLEKYPIGTQNIYVMLPEEKSAA